MTTTDADTLPPPALSHAGKVLTLTVRHQAGVSKRTGEVRFREVTTTYFLEKVKDQDGKVVALRLTTTDGEVYTVTRMACSCKSFQYRAHLMRPSCKHCQAARDLKLFDQPQEAQR